MIHELMHLCVDHCQRIGGWLPQLAPGIAKLASGFAPMARTALTNPVAQRSLARLGLVCYAAQSSCFDPHNGLTI